MFRKEPRDQRSGEVHSSLPCRGYANYRGGACPCSRTKLSSRPLLRPFCESIVSSAPVPCANDCTVNFEIGALTQVKARAGVATFAVVGLTTTVDKKYQLVSDFFQIRYTDGIFPGNLKSLKTTVLTNGSQAAGLDEINAEQKTHTCNFFGDARTASIFLFCSGIDFFTMVGMGRQGNAAQF